MARINLTMTVRFPWWSNAYIGTLNAFAMVHGLEPDTDKCAKLIAKHAKFEVVNDKETKENR